MVPTPHLNLGSLALPLNFWGIFEFWAKVGGGVAPYQVQGSSVEKSIFFQRSTFEIDHVGGKKVRYLSPV